MNNLSALHEWLVYLRKFITGSDSRIISPIPLLLRPIQMLLPYTRTADTPRLRSPSLKAYYGDL